MRLLSSRRSLRSAAVARRSRESRVTRAAGQSPRVGPAASDALRRRAQGHTPFSSDFALSSAERRRREPYCCKLVLQHRERRGVVLRHEGRRLRVAESSGPEVLRRRAAGTEPPREFRRRVSTRPPPRRPPARRTCESAKRMTSGTPPGTGTTLFACTTAAMACSTAPKRISAPAVVVPEACSKRHSATAPEAEKLAGARVGPTRRSS